MISVWALAALWLGLAAVATLLSIWQRVSTALSEIAVGTIAQFIFGLGVLGTDEPWVKFLSGLGAIVLTFLAGAELDPQVFKLKWKEVRQAIRHCTSEWSGAARIASPGRHRRRERRNSQPRKNYCERRFQPVDGTARRPRHSFVHRHGLWVQRFLVALVKFSWDCDRRRGTGLRGLRDDTLG